MAPHPEALLNEMLVLFDSTLDPETNIARDEELFRKVEGGELPELVRFWVDSECLVRGKARSGKYGWYREGLARKLGVRVVERATGGGVVYHDRGNLNWSFFLRNSGRLLSPTEMFEGASGYVVVALASLGVPARFVPPNRIDAGGFKVSGMAARSTPRARLVHGTLLLHSDLKKLNRLCIPPPGCPPVANLAKWSARITAPRVVNAVVASLKGSGFAVTMVPRDRR